MVEEEHGRGSGEGVDPRAVLSLLREVLHEVDAGQLEASSAQRAHLSGAIAALEALGRSPVDAVARAS